VKPASPSTGPTTRRRCSGRVGRARDIAGVVIDDDAERRRGAGHRRAAHRRIAFGFRVDQEFLPRPAPPVGLVEVRTLPPESVATQSELEGQATPVSPEEMLALCHAPAPPVGLVEVMALPPPSTATHREAEGQEIPLICATKLCAAPVDRGRGSTTDTAEGWSMSGPCRLRPRWRRRTTTT